MTLPMSLFTRWLLAAVLSVSVTAGVVSAAPMPTTLLTTLPMTMTMTMNPAAPAQGRPLQKNAAVSGAYVAAVPPVATETAAYLTLTNTGKAPLILTGVSSAAVQSGMLMTAERGPAGRLTMTMVQRFTLKPGQVLTFSPTGAHLMLSGLRRPLTVGQQVPLVLSFAGGTVLKVSAPVKRF